MNGVLRVRIVVILAAAAVCISPAITLGQQMQQPFFGPGGGGYSAATDQGRLQPDLTAPSPNNRVVSTGIYGADESSVTDDVAQLKEWQQNVLDKEAAAKAKAAGSPSVKVGGRVFADWYGYNQDAASFAQIGDQQNGFRFDAVRLFASGSAFHVVDYKVEFDIAGTQLDPLIVQAPTFKDVYIAVKELPLLGHLKVGHYKEPFSMDQLTSSRFVTFMERSLADVFAPARNVGVMAYDHTESENFTWGVGAFISENIDEPPIFRNDNGGTAATMRCTYLPWYDEATEGRGLIHVGMAYSYRDIADGTVRFRQRPEAELGSRVVDTGDILGVPAYQLLGLEAAAVYGPFRLQTEYMKAFVQRSGFADPEFDGVYLQISYFLTGEQRMYKRSAGTFSDRVKPFENFFRVRDENGEVHTGKGAWELAYRWSYLDLNSGAIAGGDVTDHTFGVNWYLNPYTRLMLNYVNSDLRRFGLTGNMDIVETRFQIDF